MRETVLVICAATTLVAQPPIRPRFQDFPVAQVTSIERSQLKFELPAERMFRSRLREAAGKPANFAGEMRSVIWGCGSNCGAAAFIDLGTGIIHPQPLAAGANGWDRWVIPGGMFEGAGLWGRVDSRLLIIRCGKTWIENEDLLLPDTYYFAWEGGEFRRKLKVPADRAHLPETAIRLD